MRLPRAPYGEPRLPRPKGSIARWARTLLILLSLAVLCVQVSHPVLHPLEIINPGADADHACPLSFMVAALLTALGLLLCTELSRHDAREPLPWLGHSCFLHHLAPRPPPT
jgi:hypothetical protein